MGAGSQIVVQYDDESSDNVTGTESSVTIPLTSVATHVNMEEWYFIENIFDDLQVELPLVPLQY